MAVSLRANCLPMTLLLEVNIFRKVLTSSLKGNALVQYLHEYFAGKSCLSMCRLRSKRIPMLTLHPYQALKLFQSLLWVNCSNAFQPQIWDRQLWKSPDRNLTFRALDEKPNMSYSKCSEWKSGCFAYTCTDYAL